MTPPTTDRASRLVYQGVRFDVCALERTGQGGMVIGREAVVAPGAAVVLALLDKQTVVLIRNERMVVGQTLWELPAGTIEPDEQPQACAGRELVEETGYRANELEPLIHFYPSPGICTERMHAFLARDLEHVGQHLDPNERITVEAVSLQRATKMIRDNTIQDGKTIATLLYHQFFFLKEP